MIHASCGQAGSRSVWFCTRHLWHRPGVPGKPGFGCLGQRSLGCELFLAKSQAPLSCVRLAFLFRTYREPGTFPDERSPEASRARIRGSGKTVGSWSALGIGSKNSCEKTKNRSRLALCAKYLRITCAIDAGLSLDVDLIAVSPAAFLPEVQSRKHIIRSIKASLVPDLQPRTKVWSSPRMFISPRI